MAITHVWHLGDNTTGASWATALTTVDAGIAAVGAGILDVVYMADDHFETAATTIALIETRAAVGLNAKQLIPVWRVNRTTGLYSPTTKAGLGIVNIQTTGLGFPPRDIQLGDVAMYGVKFSASSTFNVVSDTNSRLVDCHVTYGAEDSGVILGFVNCWDVQCLNTHFTATTGPSSVRIDDVSLLQMNGCSFNATADGTAFITSSNTAPHIVRLGDCDFENVTLAPNLLDDNNPTSLQSNQQVFEMKNCKLAPGMALSPANPIRSSIVSRVFDGCSEGAAREDLGMESIGGRMRMDRDVYRAAGYMDAETNSRASIALIPTASTSISNPCKTLDIIVPSNEVGAYPRTVDVTVEILKRNATPTTTEANTWLEVEYSAGSTVKMGQLNYGDRDMIQGSGVVPPASAEAWMAIPTGFVAGKLETSVLVGRKGVITVRVCTSTYNTATGVNPTLYVCPLVVLS